EYDRAINREVDRVYDTSGQVTLYTYSHGSRSSDSGRFKRNLVTMPGVENRNLGNELRQDWFVIDVPVAAEAFIAQRENRNRGAEGADMQAIREEAAKYAAERRQMRIEMARMRKEMAERGSNADSSVEERLERLQELRERELISAEEYEKKRQEILADI
ncbi:MAG: SHOCT domain-containing protein, partial [Gammaproteobacteria bacterium]